MVVSVPLPRIAKLYLFIDNLVDPRIHIDLVVEFGLGGLGVLLGHAQRVGYGG